MGVRAHNLILIGCNIGTDYYDDDEWEKEDSIYEKYDLNYKSKSGDPVLLSDGYSGKYFIVGKIVTVDYDCEGSGLGMYIMDENSDEFKNGYDEIKRIVKDVYDLDVEPKYIAMTHHT